MPAAVVALVEFQNDPELLEPGGWNRSNYESGEDFRRRPDLDPAGEFLAP